jgi:hypothetical protein
MGFVLHNGFFTGGGLLCSVHGGPPDPLMS